MTVTQKSALSLLISVVLFAAFTVLAFTGLFNLIETRFYNPSVTKSLGRELENNAKTIEKFFTELQTRFSATLDEAAVRRSFLPNQSAEDIFERTRLYGMLLESLGGLQSIRFIDSGGIRIHFSTWPQDILRREQLSVAYRDYTDSPDNLPYDQVEAPQSMATNQGRLILDEEGERIIFSLPFYDSFDVYRGTALFTLSVRAVIERLVGEGRIKVGEPVSLISNPAGIITGLPGAAAGNVLLPLVSTIWNEGMLTLSPLDSSESHTTLALISAKTGQGIFVGRLVNEELFVFPLAMKIILLCSFFLTVYLIVFLFFNFRQDAGTVVQNRLKKLQLSLIEQYYDNKSDIDWDHWARELEQRREDIRAELKQGIKFKGSDSGRDIDTLIDKSWDELLAVIGGRGYTGSGIDEEKLHAILNRILQAAPVAPGADAAGTPAPPAPVSEALEELEELDAAADDIPYSVESGGLEPAEENIVPEEFGVLEELEAVEAVTGLEELSKEKGGYEPMDLDLEVVSPFAGIPFDSPVKAAVEGSPLEELPGNNGISILYRPFVFAANKSPEILTAIDNEPASWAGPQTSMAAAKTGEVILERNGVQFINSSIFKPGRDIEKSLNRAFKELVDSVLTKK